MVTSGSNSTCVVSEKHCCHFVAVPQTLLRAWTCFLQNCQVSQSQDTQSERRWQLRESISFFLLHLFFHDFMSSFCYSCPTHILLSSDSSSRFCCRFSVFNFTTFTFETTLGLFSQDWSLHWSLFFVKFASILFCHSWQWRKRRFLLLTD